MFFGGLFFSAVVCLVLFFGGFCFVFFFLPYFVGFQLFGLIVAQEGQQTNIADNFQTTLGSIVYLFLYCSIVKFRAVFSQVNNGVTKVTKLKILVHKIFQTGNTDILSVVFTFCVE